MTTNEHAAPQPNEQNHDKQDWEPMTLTYVGHVAEVIQGGGGKLSLAGADRGDTRKPSGQG